MRSEGGGVSEGGFVRMGEGGGTGKRKGRYEA